MNILVLYQSRNGHTREAAEAIGTAAREMKHNVCVKSVIEVSKSDIQNADLLFVGTWVHGMILFGVKPAGAELWVPALPALDGKQAAVFCTYAFNPRASLRTLGSMLEARGATIIGQQAFQRGHAGDGAAAFVQRILQSARQTASAAY
jgi:flavodoxin